MEERESAAQVTNRAPTAQFEAVKCVNHTVCFWGCKMDDLAKQQKTHSSNTTAKAPSLIKRTFPSWSRKHHQLKSQLRGLTLPGRRAGHGPTEHGQVWFISGGKVEIEIHHWELLAFESNAVSSPSFNTMYFLYFSIFLMNEGLM